MKAVHICHSFGAGGITTFVDSVITLNDNSDSQHDLFLITKNEKRESSYIFHSLNFTWREFIGKCKETFRILKDYEYFFVHAAHPVVVIPLLILGRRRTVLFQHGMTASSGRYAKRAAKTIWYTVVPLTLRAKVVCSTPTARGKLTKLGIRIAESQIVYIPFGVNTNRKRTRRKKRMEHRLICLGMAGRLVQSKRFDWIIESLRAFKPNRRFQLNIAGDGPEREILAALAQKIECNRISVNLVGQLSDMTGFYEELDLFIHPGAQESFGMVVIEALVRGTPVMVFSDIGGTLDAIQNNVNGIVLDDRNSLVQLWRRLDREPDILDRLRQNSGKVDLSAYSIANTRKELDRLATASPR